MKNTAVYFYPRLIDRSAAYMARYVAKNIVAAELAERCEVALAYVIGGTEPEAITVNTFGTGKISDQRIEGLVKNVFSFGVAEVIADLELRRPQYLKTAVYGHFGRINQGFRWEETDKAWIDQALEIALEIEQGYKHTAIIHSESIEHLNRAAKMMQTSVFVKNGPSLLGIGFDKEGHTSFTIATITGEGTTSARHFARRRRCTLTSGFSIR